MQEVGSRESNELLARLSSKRCSLRRIDFRRRRPFDAHNLGAVRSRDEAAYLAEPSATLGTWRNFWGSRLPYFEAHGLPAAFPKFVVGLLDEAGASGAHKDADVTRLQEVVRFGAKAE